MTSSRAPAAVAAVLLVAASGLAGAVLRAAGERGLALASEGLLGFLEGALMAPVLGAVAFLLARAVAGVAQPRRSPEVPSPRG